jgi:hypothetical protein
MNFIQGEHTNHYTTDAVSVFLKIIWIINFFKK